MIQHDYPACATFRGGKCTCDEAEPSGSDRADFAAWNPSQKPVAWLREEYNGTGRSSVQLEPPPAELPMREQAIGVRYTPLYAHGVAPTQGGQPK